MHIEIIANIYKEARNVGKENSVGGKEDILEEGGVLTTQSEVHYTKPKPHSPCSVHDLQRYSVICF